MSATVPHARRPTTSGSGRSALTGRGVALILAAGSGHRLGLGPKALLPWEDSVLVVRAVRVAVAAGLRPVVTAGPGRGEIEAHLAAAGLGDVAVIDVPDAEVGMSASWRAGIAAIGREPGTTSATPVLVMLVDQPGIGRAVLDRLIGAFDPGRIARAAWLGFPGHPVLLPLNHARAAVRRACGDEAGRAWLRGHAHLVDLVECSDLGDASDIDTPDDLRAWREREPTNR